MEHCSQPGKNVKTDLKKTSSRIDRCLTAHTALALPDTRTLTLQKSICSPPKKKKKLSNFHKIEKENINKRSKNSRACHCVTMLTWMLRLWWWGAGRRGKCPNPRLSNHGHSYLKYKHKHNIVNWKIAGGGWQQHGNFRTFIWNTEVQFVKQPFTFTSLITFATKFLLYPMCLQPVHTVQWLARANGEIIPNNFHY